MLNLDQFAKDFFKAEKPPSDWERVYRSMIVHTRGVYPAKLLEEKRPNEPKEILDYRLANYRAITKHGINSAIDSIFRILLGSNFSIVPSDNIKKYIDETEFSFFGEQLKFEQIFFRHVLRLIFDDPNGLLVWLPENVNSDLPPMLNPEGEKINVVPIYVPSSRIRVFRDNVIAFEAEDKWLVRVPVAQNKFKNQKHPYYFWLTHDFIYRFLPEYNEREKKIVWRVHPYYNLSLTEVDGQFIEDESKAFPTLVAHQLGGNIALNELSQRYYDSFFGSYVPFGDSAICAFSDNQGVNVRGNFPYTEIKGQKCVSCKGTGKILSKDEKTLGYKITCPRCDGNRVTFPFTPYGFFINEPPAPTDNETYVAMDAVKFHGAPVDILKHSYFVWEDLLSKAKEAVNILFLKEAQSGVAKEIDREQKYEMLIKIANNFFELIEWSLNIIEAYKEPFKADRKEQIVRTPGSFAVKTAGQLTDDLTDLTTKEAPPSFIATTANRLAQKIYKDDGEAQKIIEVLTIWDPLFGKTAQQISAIKASGGATTEDVRRHTHGYTILAMLAETEDLVKLSIEDIILLADKKLEETKPEPILPVIVPTGDDDDGD